MEGVTVAFGDVGTTGSGTAGVALPDEFAMSSVALQFAAAIDDDAAGVNEVAMAAVGAVASAGSDVDTSSVGVGDGVTVELPADRDDVFVATSVNVGVVASRRSASHCHARMGANKGTGHPAAPSRVVVAPGHEAFACADDETVVPLIVTDSPTRATTAFGAARGETISS